MSNIKTKLLYVQLGIVVLIGLTFNTVVTYSKAEAFQLTAIGVYVALGIATYKINEIWQFCQKFKMAKMPSLKKGTPH